MKAITRAAVATAAIATVAGAGAQSITTLFATNNSGSAGGGVYFDVTVGGVGLLITGFDVNTTLAAGGVFGFQAWTRPGSYVGTTGSTAGWTMVTAGTGVAAGSNVPSVVTIATPFALNASTTYGFALTLSNPGGPGVAASHAYTNGTGSNQAYSNADVSLSLGAASNVFLSGTPFSPRVWNGTMYYAPVPEPGTFIALGVGLAGLAMLRRRK